MFLTDVSPAVEGMILARPIFSATGELLLAAGVTLVERYLKRLHSLGIRRVYIHDSRFEEASNDDPIGDALRQEATASINKFFGALQARTGIALLESEYVNCLQAVDSIIDELCGKDLPVAAYTQLKSYDDYTYEHSVNTCALSIMLGQKAGMTKEDLRLLGLGALFHDIGKVDIPMELLNKPGPLSFDEFEIMSSHPVKGYEAMHRLANIDPAVLTIALQHHEHPNGCGYPYGLHKTEIDDMARLVSVTDAFDALTSDRVYRKSIPNSLVLQEYISCRDGDYDSYFVDLLKMIVPLYPPCSCVELSNGEKAVVLTVTNGNINRPVVMCLGTDGKGKGDRIDLAATPDLSIVNEVDSFLSL